MQAAAVKPSAKGTPRGLMWRNLKSDGPRTLAKPSTHCRTEHTELRCIAGGAQVSEDDTHGLAGDMQANALGIS